MGHSLRSYKNLLDIININKQIFEPYGDLVDSSLLNLRTNLIRNRNAFSQQGDDEVEEQLYINYCE